MEILYVDDDIDEAVSFKEAITKVSTEVNVTHMTYCFELLLLIKYNRPDIIFLSLDPEQKDGVLFLRTIRALKELGNLPVIMYSKGVNNFHIESCYKARANFYWVKPENLDETSKRLSHFFSIDLFRQQRIAKTEFVV